MTKKKYATKKGKLSKTLDTGEKVLVLAKRIKKKSTHGKFNKQMVQNISFVNKKEIVTIRSKQKIDKNTV